MPNTSFLSIAPANLKYHQELCEQLQQIRDRKTSDDYIQLEAACIIEDAQKPLIDIIDGLHQELIKLKLVNN